MGQECNRWWAGAVRWQVLAQCLSRNRNQRLVRTRAIWSLSETTGFAAQVAPSLGPSTWLMLIVGQRPVSIHLGFLHMAARVSQYGSWLSPKHVIQETKAEAVMPFMILPQKLYWCHVHCVPLVTPATSDSIWEGTTQGCKYQQERITGGRNRNSYYPKLVALHQFLTTKM